MKQIEIVQSIVKLRRVMNMKNINRKIVALIFAMTLPIYQGITYAAAPTFDDGDSKTVSVAENTAINTEVVRLPVTDPDDDIVGVVKTGNPWARPGDFKIESSRTDTNQYAAVLKNTVTLDYETQTSYHYTVTVTDENQNTDSISVTINITNDPSDDTSNNPPVFDEGSTTTRSVDKGTYSLQDLGDPVSATDTDDDTLTYTLSGTDAALFEIDSTNGQLRNKNILDYEDKTSYSVTVTVSDNNGGTDTISVTITDDKSPVAVILTFIRQNENWVLELDSVTGVVSAVIPADDRPHSRDSSVASFTRPPGVEFDNSFIVAIVFDEEVSGLAETDLTLTENTAGANVTSSAVIMGWSRNNTVTQLRAKVEVTQSGSVTFNVAADAATDGSGNSNAAVESKTVTVTITLTEYPPWDVNEDGSVDATDLALVTDALGQTGETIVNSRTDVNWDDTVDADDVTLVTYHMDSDPIPNNPPTFVNENGEPIIASDGLYVSENLSNYLIGSVKAVAEDEDDTLTYSLDANSNYYTLMPGHKQSYIDFYTINSETGEVRIGSDGLDYEAFPFIPSYHPTHIYQPVWIKVEDGNGGNARFAYQVLIKDENDNTPVFSEDSQTLSINENELSGTTVGTVSASDADAFAGDHTYSIETENVPFTIESSKRSGTIKTTSVLDYETTTSYTLTVKVDDGFGTDTISVTINVTNDPSDDPLNNPPEFTDGTSTTRSIQENTPSGRNIGSAISATDKDTSDTLTYSLSGTDAGSFSINSNTGQLQTSATLDYETKNSYEVTVTVSDGRRGTVSITVTISVTNDTSDDPVTQLETPVVPPTDPVSEQQVSEPVQDDDTNQNQSQQGSEPEQQDDLQQPKPEADTEPEPNYTVIPFDYEKQGVGKVVFSELMLAYLGKYPQWIELYNTTDQDIDMNGWKIVGRYLDDSNAINILESQVISKSWTIKGKETVLIVSFAISNSRDRISNGLADKAYALQPTAKNFWNYEGLVLELQDAEGNPIDRIGNLNEESEIVWEIPMSARNRRISLIRRLKTALTREYNFTFGIKEFGWFPAEKAKRLIGNRSQYYYGRDSDIGSPGYRTEDGETLPVTLSSFRAQLNKNGKIILSWITESELDNAGFNILRSESRDGTFKQVNSRMIQGAGTTGERNTYTWTDTTAKPDIVYYYRIEDVSFAGSRNQLATVRTRGQISASEKYITQWGNLKKRN